MAALWLFGALGARSQEPAALVVSGPDGLRFSMTAASPRIAASPNGDCAVVWQQMRAPGGPSSIAVRRRVGGEWLREETLVSANGARTARRPAVALDSSGNPHVVWVGENAGETYLEYAFLTDFGSPKWSYFAGVANSTNTIESPPAIAFDARNRTFVVWQEGEGSLSRIHAFVVDDVGETHRATLDGEDKAHYVVYPGLAAVSDDAAPEGSDPKMAVYWFNLDEPEPRIEMRIWNAEKKAWDPFDPPTWPKSAVETLPFVLSSLETEPFLIGHQPVGRYDRVFFCSAGGEVSYLDRAPTALNRFPVASPALGDRRGIVWQQENNGAPTLIQAILKPKTLIEGGQGAVVSRPLSSVDSYLPPEPDVALSDSALLSVWIGRGGPESPSGEPGAAYRTEPAVFFAETLLSSLE